MTSTPALNKALAELQASLPKITKDETAKVDGKDGKRGYQYKYAGLDAVSAQVLPALGKLGLSFMTRPTIVDGQFGLVYELLHESGESREGFYPLPGQGTPQSIGSAITYARRYTLCAVTGVAPAEDDDDAQAANGAPVQMSRQRSAGDAWDSAAPAAPRNRQHANGHPQSAGDAWDQAAPAAPQAPADDPVIGTWAAKLDEITSQDDAERALEELDRSQRGGIIDSGRASAIRRAIKEKVRGLNGHQSQARSQQPGQHRPGQPKTGNDEEWIRDFKARLAKAPLNSLTMMRREVGQAVMNHKITSETSSVLTAEVATRRRDLEKEGAPA